MSKECREIDMNKTKKPIVATQVRISEELYHVIKTESERLAIPLNAVFISLLDDGLKYRELVINLIRGVAEQVDRSLPCNLEQH